MDKEFIAGELIKVARDLVATESYEDLSDAAEVTGNDGYLPGRTQIWYMKPSFFRDGLMGADALEEEGLLPDPRNLKKTHVLLGKIRETNPSKIFKMMQGMFYSPNGEARNLIRQNGLRHTSMSVGDVVVIGNKALLVDSFGWREL